MSPRKSQSPKIINIGTKEYEYIPKTRSYKNTKNSNDILSRRQFEQRYGRVAQAGFESIEDLQKERQKIGIPKGLRLKNYNGRNYFSKKFKTFKEMKQFIRKLPDNLLVLSKAKVKLLEYDSNGVSLKGEIRYSALTKFAEPSYLAEPKYLKKSLLDERFGKNGYIEKGYEIVIVSKSLNG